MKQVSPPAISLMMGEVAATFLSRMAVPVVYYLIARRGRAALLREEGLAPDASPSLTATNLAA